MKRYDQQMWVRTGKVNHAKQSMSCMTSRELPCSGLVLPFWPASVMLLRKKATIITNCYGSHYLCRNKEQTVSDTLPGRCSMPRHDRSPIDSYNPGKWSSNSLIFLLSHYDCFINCACLLTQSYSKHVFRLLITSTRMKKKKRNNFQPVLGQGYIVSPLSTQSSLSSPTLHEKKQTNYNQQTNKVK